jgi:Abnormal spindle-like microcephaly-assoc'd, ASPM-SPD-2-Hydin
MNNSGICSSLCLFGALSFISLGAISPVEAATFTYPLNDTGFSGFISTSCDDCTLNASNITAWSISAGGVTVSSTDPGAQVVVPAGDNDFGAHPNGVTFSFEGPFGSFTFQTASASIFFQDDEGDNVGFGPGFGDIGACTSSGCSPVNVGQGLEQISSLATPFVGAVTYKFAGTVTAASGMYSGAGASVTGTYIFDLNAGNGVLPVPFTTPWTDFSSNSSPQVLGSTLTSGSVVFTDAASVSNNTSVAGAAATGATVPSEYLANDTEFSNSTNSVKHSLQLLGGTGAQAPFDSNGLPLFANATAGATGSLTAFSGSTVVGQLNYKLTSIGPETTAVSLSPAVLSFPSTAVDASALLTATLTNNSDAVLNITSITLTGDKNDFQIFSSSCGSTLTVQASCTLQISFGPLSTGAKQAMLTVVDSASDSPQTIAMTGTATPAPMLNFSASALTFPLQQVGTVSAAKAVNLTNTGTVPVAITSVSIFQNGNDFLLKNACVASLPAGHSCTVFVTYAPTIAGLNTAALEFNDNSNNQQGFVSLTGNATNSIAGMPDAVLSTKSLAFASQTVGTASAAQVVVLTNANTGTASLNLSSASITGAQANEFSLQNACVASLAPNRSCALFVTFKPVAAGAASASLTIADNATGSPQSVALTATAAAASAPTATLNTTLLGFGNQAVGTASAGKAVVLTNNGNADLNLSSVSIAGPEANNFVLRDACVASLPAGHNCALFVTFKPSTTGTIAASLTIVDNATGSTQSVALIGTGD